MDYALTKEARRAACVHEAAHAVVMALTGGYTDTLQVAPVGATSFTAVGRKGGVHVDCWGLHSGSDIFIFPEHLAWNEDEMRYIGNRRAFEQFNNRRPKLLGHMRFLLRSHICLCMAGEIAEAIYSDDYVYLEVPPAFGEPGDDLSKAYGYSLLLPWRSELDSMAEQTEAALRNPRIWAHVIALADELERAGTLESEAIDELLPEKVPGWPASPRGKPVSV